MTDPLVNVCRTREDGSEQDTRRPLRTVARATALAGGPLFLLGVVLHPAFVWIDALAMKVREGGSTSALRPWFWRPVPAWRPPGGSAMKSCA